MTTLPANARLCHRCGEHFIGRACPKCPPALACAPPAAPVAPRGADVPKDSYDNHTDRAGKAAKLEKGIDEDKRIDYLRPVKLNIKSLYECYLRTGSVHRAAVEFNTTGETVRKHLSVAGFSLNRKLWTDSEIECIRLAYSSPHGFDLSALALKLGKTHASVACKAHDIGVCARRGKQIRTVSAKENMSAAQSEVSARPGVAETRSAATSAAFARNGHPRGMLGVRHSQDAKDAISKANFGKKVPRETVERQMKTKMERYGCLAPKVRRGSWGAKWVEIGGQKLFARSIWESNYARYLEWQKSIGEIQSWEHEPHTFWFDNIKRGVRSYLPDFRVVLKSGAVEWHEVKGWMDAKSATKIKRMAKYHPKETLRVFSAPWFKAAASNLASIVPGWETKRSTR